MALPPLDPSVRAPVAPQVNPLPYPFWAWGGLLALAWLLPGLIGHDPWKPEEAITFGVIYHLLQGGSWVNLQLTGEPLADAAPLFYWICALAARIFAGLLPLHDGARLGAGLVALASIAFLVAAARRFCADGAEARTAATISAFLLTLGSVGLIPEAHQMVPGLAMLLGYCVALFGLSRWEYSPRRGGLWLGLGIGIVCLGEGLTHTLVLSLTATLLLALFPAWRRPGWKKGIIATALCAAPLIAVWPALLSWQAPAHLPAWFGVLTHLRDLSLLEMAASAWNYLSALTWQGAPSWPLALWALWSLRRVLHEDRALQAGLLIFVTAFLLLVHDQNAGDGHRLILLPGLILLATRGIASLRRGAAHALMWFSIVFFFLFALTGWYYWVGFDLGFPERLHRHVTRMQPGYEVSEFGLRVGAGLLISAGWLWVMLRMHRSPARPLLAWTSGATLVWGLLMTLYINYLDTGRSYRLLATQVRAALPEGQGCIAGLGLGASQRAMFHYFGGFITQTVSAPAQAARCPVLLAQTQRKTPLQPGDGWQQRFAGTRLGDKNEWYQLFVRSQ